MLLACLFAAALRNYSLNFHLGNENTFPNAHRPQLACFDETARGECGYSQPLRCLVD
jgi:hypothetical protein